MEKKKDEIKTKIIMIKKKPIKETQQILFTLVDKINKYFLKFKLTLLG